MTPVKHHCAVLGSPIAHSLSPLLHNTAYGQLGLDDWLYDKHDIDANGLQGFLLGLDPTWAGLSLTMPLKRSVMSFGTPQDRWSRELAVANTATFDWAAGKPPQINLYNTDVAGIRLAFDHASRANGAGRLHRAGMKAVILGNGNTALSAVAACAEMAADSTIAVGARHAHANASIRRFAETHAGELELATITLDEAMRQLSSADIVVCTLPPHAADHIAEWLIASDSRPCGMLLDVAYDPRPSALTTAWRRTGATAVPGEEMLLYQALVQVCLMTAIPGSSWITGGEPTATDQRLEQAMRMTLGEAL